MRYQFNLPMFGVQFMFDSLHEALQAAESAIENSFFRRGDLAIRVGPGAVLAVMSEEAAQKAAAQDEVSRKSAGIVLQDRYAASTGFMLMTQFGQSVLPPLHFETREEVDEAVEVAMRNGVLRYIFEEQHDYIYVMLGSGFRLMTLEAPEYERQRREAVAAMMRQQARTASTPGAPPGRIILPGR
jgi:hypothetical protein